MQKIERIILDLEGHYEPGYIYGNFKTHKNNTNPP